VTPGIDSAEAQSILALLDELAAELGGNLRSAYWVEGVQVSDGAGAIGTVDLTSDGRAETSSTVEHADVRMTPSNHVLRGLDRTDTPVATANRLRGSLQGVTELTVDLTRAGLTLDDLDLAVTSDRITTLHLREGSTTHTVTLQPAGPLG
jgi:hypothetical protein